MTTQVINVRQPWAWCIATGQKPIENRTWQTDYRGPIAIRSAQSVDHDGFPLARRKLIRQGAILPNERLPHRHLLATKAIIAVVDLVSICGWSADELNKQPDKPNGEPWCGCGPWAIEHRYHWNLTNFRPLNEPIPAQGWIGSGIRDVTPEVLAALRTALNDPSLQ